MIRKSKETIRKSEEGLIDRLKVEWKDIAKDLSVIQT